MDANYSKPQVAPSLVDRLVDRVQSREWLDVEYKSARRALPNDIWPTVSAFANTTGGWILLGVDDNGTVHGVEEPDKVAKQFHDQVRNRQKISLPVCGASDLSIETIQAEERDSKTIIVVRVPAAARKDRPVYVNNQPYAGTYVRRGSGDYTCTKPEVDRMMREASNDSADSTILTGYGLDDLDASTIRSYRRRYQTAHSDSPLNARDDIEFLDGIGAWGRNRDRDDSAPTVAGLLVFGKQSAILAWRGRHLIDFRLEDSMNDRWLDRITWEGNLYGAFESIWTRLSEGLPVPFSLSGPSRVDTSPVHTALREAFVNLLVHADYAESDASLIIRSPDEYRFRNPGASRVGEADLYNSARSDPRNPAIVRMFRYIGLAEEAGTGIPSIMKAWHSLGLRSPEITSDRYEFSMLLRHAHLLSSEDREWLDRMGSNWSEAEQIALVTARNEGAIDNSALRRRANIHAADSSKVLVSLRNRGFLAMEGDRRNARYTLGAGGLLAQVPTGISGPGDDNDVASQISTESLLDFEASLADLRPELSGLAAKLLAMAAPMRDHSYLPSSAVDAIMVGLCEITPLSRKELARIVARNDRALQEPIRRLLAAGRLSLLYSERKTHPNQQYVVPQTGQVEVTGATRRGSSPGRRAPG